MKQEIQKSTEIKWNPDGFHFLGPEESKARRKILDTMHKFFQEKGFLEVNLPVFDFTASFEHHVSEHEKAKIIKVKDILGKEISPSLDLTVQVVKGMAGFSSNLKTSTKVYYLGKVFRDNSRGNGSRRETLQVGAEIFGHSNGNTFKLLLSIIDSIFNLLDFPYKVTIVLGNMKVITSILEKYNFSNVERKIFLTYAYTKDLSSLDTFLNQKTELSQGIKEVILDLILSFNHPEKTLQTLETQSKNLNLGIKESLEEIEDILQYCQTHLKNIDLCLDLSLVRDMDYYTGFLFHGFSGRESQPIVMGGAYDRLFEKFSGEPKRACGLAFQIDSIEELLRGETNAS
jgi:ATP phosphoribosyltransferase regulatory subunit